MKNKTVLTILLVPLVLLLVPLGAKLFTDEMAWGVFDFVAAWVLLVSAGFAYTLATRKAGNLAYRAGIGLAVATAFILTWGNIAVGFIGSEDNPVNLMYGGVIAVGVIGAFIARFQAEGMARALFATALAQFLVPVIALLLKQPDFAPGVAKVFVFNTAFAALFAGSACLFRYAARTPNGSAVGSAV